VDMARTLLLKALLPQMHGLWSLPLKTPLSPSGTAKPRSFQACTVSQAQVSQVVTGATSPRLCGKIHSKSDALFRPALHQTQSSQACTFGTLSATTILKVTSWANSSRMSRLRRSGPWVGDVTLFI